MSSPASGVVSSPTIYGKVDYGPTFGNVYRPLNTKRFISQDGGVVNVIPYDVILVIFSLSLSPITFQLPDLRLWNTQPYGGFDLIVKYLGTTDLLILPFSGQRIDGLTSIIIGGSEGTGATIISPFYANTPGSLAWFTL